MGKNNKYMPQANTELEQTKQELQNVQKQLEDYTDTLKRLQAEFENYMKRVEKERETAQNCASERVLKKLLTIADDLNRAAEQFKDSTGIRMICENIKKLMEEEGIKPIEANGKRFDPYQHEVIIKVESEEPEDTVIEELQKGYTLNGKVIRYTKVKISGGKKNGENNRN